MKLLDMQFPPVSSFFNPVRPKYLPLYSILKHLRLIFFPQCESQVTNPYKTICKITFLYSLFIQIDSKWEYKRFLAKW